LSHGAAMSNKIWSDFFDNVLPEVPGCPQAYATHQIRRSAIDFCGRSYAWLVDMTPISSGVNVPTYDFEIPTETEQVRVEDMWYNGVRLLPKSPDELSIIYRNWPIEVGTPLYYLQPTPDTFTLVPMPDTAIAGAVTAKISVKPTIDGTGIDPEVFSTWFDVIADGAKARIMATGKKPYTDVAMAKFYFGQVEAGIGSANIVVGQGQTRAPLSTSIRDSYRGITEPPIKRITNPSP
ncbi:MAG: hypothetical protein ACREA9_19605, partial [Pyrinomonadaceae bacterium]